jgi:hypothetical protein
MMSHRKPKAKKPLNADPTHSAKALMRLTGCRHSNVTIAPSNCHQRATSHQMRCNLNERRFIIVVTQMPPVRIVQHCCQFVETNQRPPLSGSDRGSNDRNWAQSCPPHMSGNPNTGNISGGIVQCGGFRYSIAHKALCANCGENARIVFGFFKSFINY